MPQPALVGIPWILDRPALEAQACECYRTVHEIVGEISGAPIRAFAKPGPQAAVGRDWRLHARLSAGRSSIESRVW